MFCSKCGKEIEENSNFCNKCGNEINPIKKEVESNLSDKPPKEEPKNEKNKTSIYLLSLICIILSGFLIFQNFSKETPNPQDTLIEVVENDVKEKIDKNEDIPPVAKEIAKSAIDKVDTKEELDKTISTISHKVDELGVEKEKIDNLVKDLESYKDKKELKENPVLQNFYIKFIDFVDSLKKSFSLNDNSQGTTKSIKDNPISSEEKSE